MKSRTEEKLEEFRNLPDGWNFGVGGPIPANQIDAGKAVYRQLLALGFSRTDAFPGPNGEVQVTAYKSDHIISVTVEADGTYTVCHEQSDHDDVEEERREWAEAKQILRKIAGEIWGTSDLLTQSYSITTQTDSATWRLKGRMVDSRYSARSVPYYAVA